MHISPRVLVAYTLRRCEWQPPPCILACELATESSHPEQGSVRKTDLTASERPLLRADYLFQDGP
jgi:hypothetical protein